MEAEKSDPPRPSVVGRPSAVAPLNPVTTGRTPAPIRGASSSEGLFPGRPHLRVGASEDGVRDHHTRRVDGQCRRSLALQIRGHQQGRQALPDRHRLVHGSRRTLAEHAHSVRDPLEIPDESLNPRNHSFLPLRRQQFAARLQVPFPQLLQVGGQPRFVAALRVAQRVQQQVRHPGHGGNHRHHRAPAPLVREDPARDAHPFGRAHAGPSELHDKQIFQWVSPFPLLVRSRMSFRIFSSTCSIPRPVEST